MYLVKTPRFIQRLFPHFVWKVPTKQRELFLTFDDGPIPEVTPWVLKTLEQFNAKATFFCVGDNVKKHPEVYEQIIKKGHAVGNHTFNHFNGWQSESLPYCQNVQKCSKLVESRLFRPPYGRLKPTQAQIINRSYDIIMWDVLSGDFDQKLSKEQCLRNVIDYARKGSVVVFHDSIKAKENLMYVLPKVLEHFSKHGFTFRSLDSAKVKTRTYAVSESA
ncbi:MAG: polysaccharide deacetylase family protein [Bacteroidota bacterium]